MSTLFESAALVISSLITLILSYFRVSVTLYQQLVVVLMLVLILGFNHLVDPNFKKLSPRFITWLILFIGSLLVQLLVISTGAILSPFLILLHLFALTVGFLISLTTSITFIILAMIVLLTHTIFDKQQLNLLLNDPGTLLLYLISFIVILPLSQFIAKRYHLKEELSRILTKQVQLGESILESLSELAIVTDKKFRILFVNDAFKKAFNLDQPEVQDKFLFDILTLKDKEGHPVDLKSLPLDRVLVDKATRIVDGLLLYTKKRNTPYQVTIQIRPISNAEGQIEQLSLVLTESATSDINLRHADLEKASLGQKQLLEHIQDHLKKAKLTSLEVEMELLNKLEQDLVLSRELEDHAMKENIELTDLAILTQNVTYSKQSLAKSLRVNLEFSLPQDEVKEEFLMHLKQAGTPAEILAISDYAVPIDGKWMAILIAKLIDISILLAFDNEKSSVKVTIDSKMAQSVIVTIKALRISLKQLPTDLLFKQYYGNLIENTNLKLGSGLEGFIAKAISNQLSIPLETDYNTILHQLNFTITLSKKAH